MRTLFDDARFGLRILKKNPGFAAVAILTLALGVGANTAIFSVVHAVVLKPLPFRDPDRLLLFMTSRADGTPSVTSNSLPDFEDWRQQAASFSEMGLLSGWTFNLTGRELPERIFGARVSGTLFPLIGATPLLGRTIEPDDDQPGRDEVVVLGFDVWHRLFGGDPRIIGQPLMMEGRPHLVIGVMGPDFHFPSPDIELWSAIKDNMTGMPRDGRFMVAAGRLRAGVTQAAAQAEIDTLSTRLAAEYPLTNRGWRTTLATARDALIADVKPAMFLLLGAVGLVLLIACANLSNLLLARVAARTRESAVRLALGATRGRIVSQMLVENLVVALIGGTAGVLLAYAATGALVSFGPADIPRLAETRVDGIVLLFALGVSGFAGAVPALVPALRASRVDLQPSLKDGSGGYTGARAAHRAGAALIVVEVALAVTLAVCGGLLLRSFAAVTSTAPGFDTRNVLSLKVFLTPPRYRTVASGKTYVRDALDRIASVPGVESVAAISQLPMGDPSSNLRFEIDGQPFSAEGSPSTAYRAISRSYFDVMKIPLLRGRSITDADNESSQYVIVINDTMARRFFAGRDPIGQRIRWNTSGNDPRWLTIVGVVADVKSAGLDRGEGPAVYAHYTQRLFTWLRWTSFAVRTHGEPLQYAVPIRRALAGVDPNQPVYEVAPLERVIAQSVAARRFNTLLLDLFAALALSLAAVGVYGTIGYWVAQRTREIGVRMALGATRRAITVMVVGRSASLTCAGVVLGIILAAAATRLLTALLFQVCPIDPFTFVAVALLVTALGVAAAYIPARRASRTDPVQVMR